MVSAVWWGCLGCCGGAHAWGPGERGVEAEILLGKGKMETPP